MFRRAVVLLLSLLAADVAAQAVTLTVSDAGELMQSATLDDYANGYIIGSTPVTYTVSIAANPGGNGLCATVQLTGETAAGGDRNLSDVLWGLTAASQTMPLSNSAQVVDRHLLTNSARSASGVIYFRTINLGWGDGPKTYLGPSLIFNVSGRRGAC